MSFSGRVLAALSVPLVALSVALAPAADAAGGSAPGSLTGYAFDTCSAPSQAVMDAWRTASPYAGVGVYIGGSNRLCDQPELTASWVRTQVSNGWHVLPAWVGPQASCSGYADTMSSDLATAFAQGQAQAGAAVATARSLGIGGGSTLYYDLEDYSLAATDCRQAALSLMSGWTQALHHAGYRSGVYSNIAAAITSLDLADRVSQGDYAMPDDIWYAWANNRADTKVDDRVLSDEWDGHQRVHQYAIGQSQTYGGYTVTVDSNWVDVGKGSVAPREKPLCRGVDVDLKRYPALRVGRSGPAVKALQCVLRHAHVGVALTGRYDARTAAAVRKAQHKLHLKPTGKVTRTTWSALLAKGSTPLLKVGSTGEPVLRLQRALTAAVKRTPIDGVYSTRTAQAVAKLQRKSGLPQTGVTTPEIWSALSNR